MGRFFLKRLLQGVVVILGVTVVVFVVTRLVGDPVKVMLPLEATAEQRAEFEKQLGLDRPIGVQFIDFLAGLTRLDFGESLWQRRPAMTIVLEKLPLTLELASLGIGWRSSCRFRWESSQPSGRGAPSIAARFS